MRHKQGKSRHQTTLFPESLDALLPADHPVRVIDAFVDILDLAQLGFAKAITRQTGRRPYHPGDLLKLYLYGYLNQVRSSRRLERESHRNIELLWLLNRLCPDFKTIADFRRENSSAIQKACREFVLFCREQKLFGAQLIAIDGSKFQAASSGRQMYTADQIAEQMQRVEMSIAVYLQALEQSEENEAQEEKDHLKTKAALAALLERKNKLQKVQEEMKEHRQRQGSITETEAHSMQHGTGQVLASYNVQTAVDSKHQLIVHHEVLQENNDTGQLYPMAHEAKEVLEAESLNVVADTGYSNGEQFHQCEQENIEAYVPPKRGSNTQGDYFEKTEFVYDGVTDSYCCPAGERLPRKTHSTKKKLIWYTTEKCTGCELKHQCTGAQKRWVSRHFYEKEFEEMERRIKNHPEMMKKRKAVVEPPFGTIKRMMGNPRFLCRGLKQVKSEMSLSVMAYNFLRVLNIWGAKEFMARLV